jgi:hypothetical protein
VRRLAAHAYAAGEADAPALALAQPLSFWGGIEAQTGRIIDHFHPDRGRSVAGVVLVMPGGRGSSSSSAVLAEALRLGTAPAGIVLGVVDPILTVGALVAHALYGVRCPVVVADVASIATGDRVRIRASDHGEAQIDWWPGGGLAR